MIMILPNDERIHFGLQRKRGKVQIIIDDAHKEYVKLSFGSLIKHITPLILNHSKTFTFGTKRIGLGITPSFFIDGIDLAWFRKERKRSLSFTEELDIIETQLRVKIERI